jgi:hypothetical protein
MARIMALFCFTLIGVFAFVVSQGPPECALGHPGPLGPNTSQCSENEVFTNCGNNCEISCANIGEAPEYKNLLDTLGWSGCVAGCYCKPGYIRDDFDLCVLHTPDTCGKCYTFQFFDYIL